METDLTLSPIAVICYALLPLAPMSIASCLRWKSKRWRNYHRYLLVAGPSGAIASLAITIAAVSLMSSFTPDPDALVSAGAVVTATALAAGSIMTLAGLSALI